MDREAAFRQLADYWALANSAQKLPLFSKERRAAAKALNEQVPGINRILRDIAPDLPLITPHGIGEHVATSPLISRALDLINRWRAMEACAPSADLPVVPFNILDPVVTTAALPLWKAGKFRQAVSDAATNLNSFAQDRIGRHDISDKDLMAQAFSDKEPEPGKARLRCPGNPESETVRSQHEGARAFAIGTFQAIRNPAHHLTGDWNPVTAFHHLMALSQVAHWFRYWRVVRTYMPDPTAATLMQAMKALSEANRASAAASDQTNQ